GADAAAQSSLSIDRRGSSSLLIKTQGSLDLVMPAVADAVVQLANASSDIASDAFLTEDEKRHISLLQQLDTRSRHDKNKLIFQGIATRLEAKRLLQLVERSVPQESGE